MTDLLRLATELERSGGTHRLTALIACAVRVAWEREHPTGAGMSDRVVRIQRALDMTRECEPGVPHQWHDTGDGEMCAACCATRRTVTVRGERWPLPVTEQTPDCRAASVAPDADVAFGRNPAGREPRGHKSNDLQTTLNPVEIGSSVVGPYWTDALHFSQRGADCQDEPSITHAPDSPIPELVREPARRCVPRYPNPEDDGA